MQREVREELLTWAGDCAADPGTDADAALDAGLPGGGVVWAGFVLLAGCTVKHRASAHVDVCVVREVRELLTLTGDVAADTGTESLPSLSSGAASARCLEPRRPGGIRFRGRRADAP